MNLNKEGIIIKEAKAQNYKCCGQIILNNEITQYLICGQLVTKLFDKTSNRFLCNNCYKMNKEGGILI